MNLLLSPPESLDYVKYLGAVCNYLFPKTSLEALAHLFLHTNTLTHSRFQALVSASLCPNYNPNATYPHQLRSNLPHTESHIWRSFY